MFLLAVIFLPAAVSAQRLGRFGKGDTGQGETAYGTIKSYFGYADSTTFPAEMISDTGYYIIYFTLADSVPDLGLRLISPVPALVFPDRGDRVSDNYYENEKKRNASFDPIMYLQVLTLQTEGDSIITGSQEWKNIAFNDDSRELSPPASSLIRLKQPLPPGAYRIAFKSKDNKVKGGYLVQLGSSGPVSNVKLSDKREP